MDIEILDVDSRREAVVVRGPGPGRAAVGRPSAVHAKGGAGVKGERSHAIDGQGLNRSAGRQVEGDVRATHRRGRSRGAEQPVDPARSTGTESYINSSWILGIDLDVPNAGAGRGEDRIPARARRPGLQDALAGTHVVEVHAAIDG